MPEAAPGAASPDRAARWILWGGVALRVLLFCVMGPFNNDDHIKVIQYIVEHHALPHIDQLNQAYHPPLYHLAAAAVLAATGSIKAVQGLSLVCSIVTLLLAWRLIARLSVFSRRARFWMLMLLAFHPEFVTYNLFISNDPPAIMLGAAILTAAEAYLRRPGARRALGVALLLGAGLSTKGTFLAFLAPLALMILIAERRRALAWRAVLARVALLLAVAGALGCYKFIDNARVTGNPLASNLDMNWKWVGEAKPAWIGSASLLDFDLLRIIRIPVVTSPAAHSIPLVMYGTMWYAFIPESTLRSNVSPWNFLGGVIYVLALAPTLLIVAGFFLLAVRFAPRRAGAPGQADAAVRSEPSDAAQRTLVWIAVLILFMILAMVLIVGLKSNVWNVYQSRLLFPAYPAILFCLAAGLDALAGRARALSRAAGVALLLLHVAFAAYVAADVTISIIHPINPYRSLHMPYGLDLRQR